MKSDLPWAAYQRGEVGLMWLSVSLKQHRVSAKLRLLCLKVRHEEGMEDHTQWRTPFAPSVFCLHFWGQMAAEPQDWLFGWYETVAATKVKVLKLRLRGLAVCSCRESCGICWAGREVTWRGAGAKICPKSDGNTKFICQTLMDWDPCCLSSAGGLANPWLPTNPSNSHTMGVSAALTTLVHRDLFGN